MKQTDSLLPFLTESKKKALACKRDLEKIIGPFSFKNQRFNLALFGSILVAWFLLGTLLSSGAPKYKDPSASFARVQVIDSIAQEKTTYYKLQGSLEALNKVTLRAETPGLVKSISAEKGDELLLGESILNLSFESRLGRLREAQVLVDQRHLEYKNAQQLQSSKFRSKTAVAEAKSKMEAAQAALEQTQSDIEDTKVRAPFKGRVDTRYVQLGDYVKAGDALVDFVSLDPILAVVNISEKDIKRIKLGAHSTIDCQGQCTTGEVTFISKIADPNTRTYRVEITLDNSNGELLDGITTSIMIPVDTSMAHLFSPAALAMADDGIPGIKTVDEHNKVLFHPIDILNHDETGMWVKGLPGEARIITVGQYYVQTGDTVEPVLEQPPKE